MRTAPRTITACAMQTLLVVAMVLMVGLSHAEDNLTGITPQQHQQIGWMEEALLGATHPTDSPTERLSDLEYAIFGQDYSPQSVVQRLDNLDQALRARKKAVELSHQPPMPNNTPSAVPPSSGTVDGSSSIDIGNTAYSRPEPSVNSKNKSVRSTTPTVSDTQANNRVVDQMEHRVFNRVYSQEPLVSRLTRLELSVMGYQQSGHLAARTDNLRWLVLGAEEQPDSLTNANAPPQQVAQHPMAPPQHYIPDPAQQQPAVASAAPIQGYPGQVYTGQSPYGQQPGMSSASVADMQQALSTIEKQQFKMSYPVDPIPVRLARLEQKIFNQTAERSGYSDEDRLQRIIAVSAAEKDSVAASRGPSGGIKSMWPLIPILVLMLL